jgi:stringent starvation protein B
MPPPQRDPRLDGPNPPATQHGLTQDELNRLLHAIDEMNFLASNITFNGEVSVSFSAPFAEVIAVQARTSTHFTMFTLASVYEPSDATTDSQVLVCAAKNGPRPIDPEDFQISAIRELEIMKRRFG